MSSPSDPEELPPMVLDPDDEHARRHAAYIEAREAVAPALKVQADAEIARGRWLRKHRAVPPHLIFDPKTGDPLPGTELAALEQQVADAVAAVDWCRAVEVACMEAVKGEPLEVTLERNAAGRAHMVELHDSALEILVEQAT